MKRGDITQSSFAFQVESDSWNTTSKGEIRTIEKVSRLFDVSPVSIPAYPTANDLSIAQRSRMTYKDKTKMKQESEYENRNNLLELKINILKRK
jgi:phage head maturation protease